MPQQICLKGHDEREELSSLYECPHCDDGGHLTYVARCDVYRRVEKDGRLEAAFEMEVDIEDEDDARLFCADCQTYFKIPSDKVDEWALNPA